MNEPWELRPEPERSAEKVFNVIIFCEDGEVEPSYFRLFQSDSVKINIAEECKTKQHQLNYAMQYCDDKNFIDKTSNPPKLAFNIGTAFWCVFDRDKVVGEPKTKDWEFTNAIAQLETAGFNVAWSNDVFELWFLLHFIDVASIPEKFPMRDDCYDELTSIIKTESTNPKTTNANFSYRGSMKGKKSFFNITLPLLRGKTTQAIERAKLLKQLHDAPPKWAHEKIPVTMVYVLVEELLVNGGRVI